MSGLRTTLQRHVDDGTLPGAVAIVDRNGEVEVEAVGEVARDSIFRIASIGKPITAASVMLLVEEGRVGLDDPIERWLPELASPVVVRTPASQIDDVVPCVRPITVRDVLESRAGWGFPADFSLPVVQLLFQRAFAFGRPFSGVDEWLAGLARVPLLAQPGEAWLYNACSDVQGALVERASGQFFSTFLAERIFEPLGMVDTAFHVPAAKLDRLPPYYAADLAPIDPALDRYTDEPGFASGAGGLVSTADDWLAFGRMLLADGAPLLSAESVRLMATDHLTAAQREAGALFLEGQGWGYGGAVAGGGDRYGWVGGTGTAAHVVFSSQTVAVLLTQVQMTGPTTTPLMHDFWRVAGV